MVETRRIKGNCGLCACWPGLRFLICIRSALDWNNKSFSICKCLCVYDEREQSFTSCVYCLTEHHRHLSLHWAGLSMGTCHIKWALGFLHSGVEVLQALIHMTRYCGRSTLTWLWCNWCVIMVMIQLWLCHVLMLCVWQTFLSGAWLAMHLVLIWTLHQINTKYWSKCSISVFFVFWSYLLTNQPISSLPLEILVNYSNHTPTLL